jgi:hypothetical protein
MQSLYSLSYFLAATYATAWLVRLTLAVYHRARNPGLRRPFARQSGFLRLRLPRGSGLQILLVVSGMVFGWALITWAGDWFVREWLLLVLPGLTLLSHELLLTKRDYSLFAILALMAGLHNQREAGTDVFERFAKIFDGLPEGEVKQAAREALQRRRSGSPVEQSCQVLYGLHRLLDELLFTLRLAGWQATSAFDLVLGRLLQRAGRQWDRLSRSLVLREQARPFVLFSQAAILSVLAVLVIEDIPSFRLAWTSYAVIGWVGLAGILTIGFFYAAQDRPWLRRLLGVSMITASLLVMLQVASSPRLFELQRQVVTHWGEGALPEKIAVQPTRTIRIEPTIVEPVPQISNQPSSTRPILPAPIPTIAEGQLQPLSTPASHLEPNRSWQIICCQPR